MENTSNSDIKMLLVLLVKNQKDIPFEELQQIQRLNDKIIFNKKRADSNNNDLIINSYFDSINL